MKTWTQYKTLAVEYNYFEIKKYKSKLAETIECKMTIQLFSNFTTSCLTNECEQKKKNITKLSRKRRTMLYNSYQYTLYIHTYPHFVSTVKKIDIWQ